MCATARAAGRGREVDKTIGRGCCDRGRHYLELALWMLLPFALTASTLLPQRNFSQAVLSSRLGSSVPRSHPEHNQSPCEWVCTKEGVHLLQPAHSVEPRVNRRRDWRESVHG